MLRFLSRFLSGRRPPNGILPFLLLAALAGACSSHRPASRDAVHAVTVVFENDVHCAVDGYASLKAYRDSLQGAGIDVLTVSCGDFVQGGSLGAASMGRAVVDIMNAVGYDAVTVGNHEFDYGVGRMLELADALSAECVCCNLTDLRSSERLLSPYVIRRVRDLSVAFIGIATPYTVSTSTPTYFHDSMGRLIYGFCADNLLDCVQRSVNAARAEGADFVVALSHLGDTPQGDDGVTSIYLIEGTYGIDAVLDGHSHSVIPSRTVLNRKGHPVLLSSTGSSLENIGVLTLSSDGNVSSCLVPTSEVTALDVNIERMISDLRRGYSRTASRPVGVCHSSLECADSTGAWLARMEESALGNLCADAFRAVLGTEVAVVNGGGIRAPLPAGQVTWGDIFSVLPFGNEAVSCLVRGSTIMDMLEFSVSAAPEEFGGFQQVSGMRFTYDSSYPSPVTCDSSHVFTGMSGRRRVVSVDVLDPATGKYVPLDPDREYSLAASGYLVRDLGDGFAMMSDAACVVGSGMTDTEILEKYIASFLDGTVGEGCSEPQGRIADLCRP